MTRALRLIGEGVLVDGGVDDLADRLGMGSRQLRRLFVEHLGAPPAAIEQTRRVHFAKKLLDETDLPITEIALTSGFNSVRRFNSAIRTAYKRSPRELRKRETRGSGSASVCLRLGFRPPFDWDQITGFLRIRAIPGVEVVSANEYARSVAVGSYRGVLRVRPGKGDWLELEISNDASGELSRIVAGVRAVFDLGADPQRISEHLGDHRLLRKAVRRCPGLRVPGAWDPFELTVRAILGQQVTVRGATTLAGRIAARYGASIETDVAGIDRLFPRPEAMVEMEVAGQGMPTRRAETVRALAKTIERGERLFDGEPSEFVDTLCGIPGLGPWTANYVAMRALGDPDSFPASDLGLRKAVANIERGGMPTAAQLERTAESWRPWRSYAAMYLWKSLDSGD